MATERITIDEAMPLDLALWRKYGVEIRGFVEQTLENNPGLADKGVIMSAGTSFDVIVPDVAAGRLNAPLPMFMRK